MTSTSGRPVRSVLFSHGTYLGGFANIPSRHRGDLVFDVEYVVLGPYSVRRLRIKTGVVSSIQIGAEAAPIIVRTIHGNAGYFDVEGKSAAYIGEQLLPWMDAVGIPTYEDHRSISRPKHSLAAIAESSAPAAQPAGWYPDGVTSFVERWFDGNAWTETTRPNPAVMYAAPTVSRPKPPSRRERNREELASKQESLRITNWQREEVEDWTAEGERIEDGLARLDVPGQLQTNVMMHPGEIALWQVTGGSLIAPRQGASHLAGRSQGISVPIMQGIRYQIGANSGTYLPGPEVQTPIDTGDIVVTTERVVFVGINTTRQWDWDKLVSIAKSEDGSTAIIHVSNRDSATGIHALPDLPFWLALAVSVATNGIDNARAELSEMREQHLATDPRQKPIS